MTPPTITTMTMQQYNKHYDTTHRSIKNVMIHCKQNIIGINQLKNQATLKVLKRNSEDLNDIYRIYSYIITKEKKQLILLYNGQQISDN